MKRYQILFYCTDEDSVTGQSITKTFHRGSVQLSDEELSELRKKGVFDNELTSRVAMQLANEMFINFKPKEKSQQK